MGNNLTFAQEGKVIGVIFFWKSKKKKLHYTNLETISHQRLLCSQKPKKAFLAHGAWFCERLYL